MEKDDILKSLFDVVKQRKVNYSENSYTCYLFDKGLDKILKKVGEECSETIIAAKNEDKDALVGEICDLIYHLVVMSVEKNVECDDILKELDSRANKIGNLKTMKNVDKLT